MTAFPLPPETSRLPDPYREELPLVQALAAEMQALNWRAVVDQARPWVQQVRGIRRRSGRWNRCCANTRSPVPKAWR
ncbi:hypothetical protein ACQ86G_06825 [Roseateles chitinivorans]|uniref:hypothetical protein n=1 Tax=Roseateles chitinivorans TaxID=2917965 RepID=UPI003D66A631